MSIHLQIKDMPTSPKKKKKCLELRKPKWSLAGKLIDCAIFGGEYQCPVNNMKNNATNETKHLS